MPAPSTRPFSRLIGPFRVRYGDAGLLGSPGIAWGDLPAGSVVVSAWAVVVEPFDDGSGTVSALLRLGGRDFATHGDVMHLAISYAVGGTDPNPNSRTSAVVAAEFPANPLYCFPLVAQGHAELFVSLNVSDIPTLNQGDADLYALVVAP